jgi:hypothetical protein
MTAPFVDFKNIMRRVAVELLGEPNKVLSSKHELRFGTHGSLAIDLRGARWFDHENGIGGGVLDLIARETGRRGPDAIDWLREHGHVAEAPHSGSGNGAARARRHVVATYPYRDEDGALLYEVVRYEPKSFSQRRPNGNGGYVNNIDGVRRVPYRLPEVIDAVAQDKPVFTTEGEKDADAVTKLGAMATTNAGGVGKWRHEYNEFLRGADVILLPHNDEKGREHMHAVATSLAGVAARIRVLDIANHWAECPAKGDISNWIAAGGTAKALWDLVDAAPEWTPSFGAFDSAPKRHVWPDPTPLPAVLLPVMPFDYDLLPEKLRPWARDVCERMQCPPDFVAVGIMAALGSVIGRKCAVRAQIEDDWTVVPNLWALGIGRPSVMKSPAMEEALRPLKALALKARTEFDLAWAAYEAQAAAAKMRTKNSEKEAAKALAKNELANLEDFLKVEHVEEPALKRYMTSSATVEALGVLLQQNPNGILVHRDEMVSLLDSLDEEGHAEARGFYLTSWNGDSGYTVDRIVRGLNQHIEAVCLSLLGGTQPGRIAQYLDRALRGGRGDDGLVQRFSLMVWPDISTDWKHVDRKPDHEARKLAFEVFEALDGLDWHAIGGKRDRGPSGDEEGLPYLRFGLDAHERFVAWWSELEGRLRRDELHPAMESHLAKYRKLVPAVALISHLADGGTRYVGVAAVERAIAWATYLETHAARAYGSVTAGASSTAKAIIAKVRSGHLKSEFSSRDVWRPRWSLLSDREAVQAGLNMLVDYDWLGAHKVETGGRPAIVYMVNPKVLAANGKKKSPEGSLPKLPQGI